MPEASLTPPLLPKKIGGTRSANLPLLLRESGITLRRKRKLADHIELKLLWNYGQPWREWSAESWHSATLNSLFANRSRAATTSRSRHSQNTSAIGLWIKTMFPRRLRYHRLQGIADRRSEAKFQDEECPRQWCATTKREKRKQHRYSEPRAFNQL